MCPPPLPPRTASAGHSCAPAPTAAQPPPTGPGRGAARGRCGLCGSKARAPSRGRPGPAAAVRNTAFVSAAPRCREGAPRARLQMRRSPQAARGKAGSAATDRWPFSRHRAPHGPQCCHGTLSSRSSVASRSYRSRSQRTGTRLVQRERKRERCSLERHRTHSF